MNPVFITYGSLVIAIVCEVIATSFLQQTQQFTKLVPTLLMAVFYGAAFYFLSHSLRAIPVGVAYALWSGLGIVLISAVGYVAFKQSLDPPALIGIGLIVAGVIVINVFSQAVSH
ncbi:small multidrug resistance pump [Bosea sp. BE271]|uniref:DMT family transporter n=1 Tax=Bosea TaxID=85413 RepID=UPI002861FDB6|nr:MULTISPECIES: multidrug efflux SMR transporter [Bosea]MDR6827673.1 small multidrug resistance pump [Bosea robiniae]MDR6894633.1 small multidrug resistance pump [Bosea sp. BE109]MDR7137779.1 small multidrug resistance pump [Bosea sp. BE168]MDR7174478.1 small multidrug resistance pump [Bosea sp. BE271]